MPTLLSHPAVPLALAMGLGREWIPPRLLLAGMVVSILPDVDVVAFRLGISYLDVWGHRGFSHSLLFALGVAVLGAVVASWWRAERGITFWFLWGAMASHGLLDTLTNGGEGIALLWPFADGRYFAPVQVIEVAPLSLARFFGERGVTVLWSELLWVWIPCVLLVLLLRLLRRSFRWRAQSAG